MAEETKTDAKALDELVKAFTQLPEGQEKNAFFHANPALHSIFNGIHFPKPKPAVGSQKSESAPAAGSTPPETIPTP